MKEDANDALMLTICFPFCIALTCALATDVEMTCQPQTAGYVVMQGYWKDPQRTDEALERHPDEPEIVWMRTGDIAIMDEEGYVRIVGRSKDVIIRGGE